MNISVRFDGEFSKGCQDYVLSYLMQRYYSPSGVYFLIVVHETIARVWAEVRVREDESAPTEVEELNELFL